MPSTPINLLPGTLPPGYCYPDDPQDLNVAIITRAQAFLDETFPGIWVSDVAPPVSMRNRLWFNTISSRWYQFVNGDWMRVYEVEASSDVEWIWKGDEANLATFAGGDAGAVGLYTGPLWEVDHEIDGRALVGPGVIPGSSPAVTLALGDTGGEFEHVLTEAEGAVGEHVHPFGQSHVGNDDAYFALGNAGSVPSYSGFYVTGSNGNIVANQTTADLVTLKANAGAGVVAVGHANMQPYIARYVIKRTARIWVTAPN